MPIGEVFYSVMVDDLQLLIYSLVGAALRWLGPFDPIGEKRTADANLHFFIPMFCFVEFSTAVQNMSQQALSLLMFTIVISSLFAVFFAYIYTWVAKTDVRISNVFLLMVGFGNVCFMPLVLTRGLCSVKGTWSAEPSCANNVAYSFYELFIFNCPLLAFGPLVMARDKATGYNVRRQMMLVKHYYPRTPQDFLDDTDLVAMKGVSNNQGKAEPGVVAVNMPNEGGNSPTPNKGNQVVTMHNKEEMYGTSAVLNAGIGLGKDDFKEEKGSKVPESVLNDQDLVNYSLDLHMDRDTYQKFQDHFAKFFELINVDFYQKEFSNKMPNAIHMPGFDMALVEHIYKCKALWGCILGCIIGRIPTIMTWLYDPNLGIYYFMGTIEGLAGLVLPLCIMILGIQLGPGFHFKGSNIRIHEVIAFIVIRLMIVPAIGLGFVWGMANDSIPAFQGDKVLQFHMFANWVVQPGLLMMTLFVLCGYYAKEGSLVYFYSTIANIVCGPLYTYAYFQMFSMKA